MCVHRTDEGFCKKFSVDGVTSYCVEGPCPDDVLTNADRIRAMDDKELAEFLCGVYDDDDCRGKHICGVVIPAYTVDDILEWLQREED